MDLEKNIKVIVFDFDGTLHNLKVDWQKARRAVGAKSGEKLGEIVERIKKESPERLKILDDIEHAALNGERLDRTVYQTLESLSRRYKIAVLSRNSSKAIRKFLAQNAIRPDYIVGREETRRLKPHPEGLSYIARYFHCGPHEILMVGDTWHDLVVAKNAGSPCVIIGHNLTGFAEQPKYHIDTIEGLLGLLTADLPK